MEKIKQFLQSDKAKDILVVIIVILVGMGSFELGRLSKEANSGGIKIEYGDQQQANTVASITEPTPKAAAVSDSIRKSFFASSKGSKYYSLGCSAGKTIKQENRVYFATGEEAQAAGYTLSAACN